MGNLLTAIAPSQILPVEQYLSECPNWKFENSLGCTRFFKVAKVRSNDGLMIVKVFVIHDPSLDLKGYKTQIEKMKSSLNWMLNCSPFHSIIQTDKAVMICRRFVDSSLYDRISTKPFLTLIEKKWIAFLLLNAINQCHKLSIFHGDIKSENVLLTSWNWVLLTDFANFKPTFLPDNNPAGFSYYFDTSNRRACYIAPERFIEANSFEVASISAEPLANVELTAAMDVFSAGCVLIELFTEGDVPFDLSQLLSYRAGEYYPQKSIDSIKDEGIKILVEQMIQIDPKSRLNIDKYLSNHKGSTFPEIFYVFLKPYCQRFASLPFLHADERIARIAKRDFDLITQKIDRYSEGQRQEINDSFLIVLPIVISSINKLQLPESKLQALNLFASFSLHLSSDIIIDRVIPAILILAKDKDPIIRCEMLRVLNFCFLKANTVSNCDSNLFTEYIFPSINHLANDSNSELRINFARYIASFAEHARRCLELIWLQNEKSENQGNDETQNEVCERQKLYKKELDSLNGVVQQMVVQLFGDKENCIKISLLDSDFQKLCLFFGRSKTCDIIFSHMITFFNDKRDWQLRMTFFQKVVGVINLLGQQFSQVLKSLLQHGLSDSEEFNVVNSLSCMGSLVELNLIQKPLVLKLLDDAVPLLHHPNVWIRKEVIGFIVKLSKELGWIDEQCYILPALDNYISGNVPSIEDGMVLLFSLNTPLPLQIYRQLTRSSTSLEKFLEFLVKSGEGIEISEENSFLMRKLEFQGMTEEDKRKILMMSNHLKGLQRSKALDMSSANFAATFLIDKNRNIIDLKESLPGLDLARRYDYRSSDGGSLSDASFSSRGRATNKKIPNVDQSMNEDWKQMFGPDSNTPERITELARRGDDQTFQSVNSSDSHEPTKKILAEPLTKPIVSSNKTKFETLLAKEREHYLREIAPFDSMNELEWKEKTQSQDWRPQGIMVAHLHEHGGAINRLCASSDGQHFASCSNDGSVKIWNTSRFDGKSITNRSRMTYSKLSGQLKAMCFCDKSQSLVSSSDRGMVHLFRFDTKTEPILMREVNSKKDGVIVDMTSCEAGSESVVILATSYGRLFGWDIRMPSGYAWKVQEDCHRGLITSIDAHKQLSWFVVATEKGIHTCWDRRFLLPVNTFSHPNGSRIRRVIVDKNAQSVVLSSSYCNNELTIFDFETSTRQKTLWASPTPVLGYAQSTKHYLGGIHADSNYVITAGSDMRLRYWDLKMPRDSYIIAGSAHDSRNIGSKVSYHSRLIEATAVIYEAYENQKASTDEPKDNFLDIPVGHKNVITDLVVCSSSQQYIVTSTQDGIIKVWK